MKYGTRKKFVPAVYYMFHVTCFIILFLLPLALPSVVFAQGLVPCGSESYSEAEQTTRETAIKTAISENEKKTPAAKTSLPKMIFAGELKDPCGFEHVIELAKRTINWLIGIGVIVATMGFAYAGFLYITAAGSEEKIKHAHSIFVKILVGFTLMLGAWLITKGFEGAF